MARDLTAALNTEMKADTLQPFVLVELQYPSGTIRFWNGLGDLTALSQTWTGGGNLLTITEVRETESVVATGVIFGLSGIPSAALSNALSQDYQDRLAKMYIGAFNNAGAVVADPYLVFEGRMDVQTIQDDGTTATVQVSTESRLVDLERARERRYTPEDQELDFSGDKGFEFVVSLQNKEVIWNP